MNSTPSAPPLKMEALDLDIFQPSLTLGLGAILVVLMSFLAFLSYTPSFDKKVPAFTTHTHPFIGAADFMWRKNHFWRASMEESKTGTFSFWVGKKHVVGLSGEAARKTFMDSPGLDFVGGARIRGVSLLPNPPTPEIFRPGFHHGRSFFLRRMIDMQKTEMLKRCLPRFTSDSRGVFDELAKDPSGITNPAVACWHVVFAHDVILFCSEEIVDDPKAFPNLLQMIDILQGLSSFTKVFLPWLPTMAGMTRARRYKYMKSIFEPLVDRRMKRGAIRREDSLQLMIDNGDRRDLIIDFVIAAVIIAPTNSRILTGQMLNVMAAYPSWQEKAYAEIKALAKSYAKDPEAPLADQLDSMPLEAWEAGFPSIDLCFKELVRMWVAISMMRRNISSRTDEFIPAGSFAIYNTTETHFSEELYPDPHTFKPERWLEGNANVQKQAYGFVGWGEGRHPCPGKRWAKLQLNITIAYALAKFKWTSVDKTEHKKSTQESGHGVPLPSKLSKFSPREEN
uniref:Cytochrome P450 monooxygenase dmxR5 n=1 Tax=Cryptosporiopsis sp. (strain 8999) TaxID=2572248 RepID=DMXR5_CRYX8|nr:RecName: Full=Cytochrome P450 monooxygenase dmxR5; AltName: Full=Dimeric xanthone biosynthesis cluster protein R5 [Cryptosporiopsis sp. 8999]QCL09096.1 DmxR5 [Cryptosporiopsis sp. 8999]